VERRTENLDVGLHRLEEAAASIGSFDESFAHRLTDRLLAGANHDDDTCVLAARIEPPGGFVHELPAAPTELADLRRQLHHWLDAASVDGEVAKAVVLATSEAAANAIEHAYGMDGTGVTVVRAALEADELHLVVSDHGIWQQPALPGDRGRGRYLMRNCMDDVTIVKDPTGTVVRMRRRITQETSS
jgi:serine/threonine-protein kinase RsbW